MSWQASELGDDWLGCKGKSIGTIIFPLKTLASSAKRNMSRWTYHTLLRSILQPLLGEQGTK